MMTGFGEGIIDRKRGQKVIFQRFPQLTGGRRFPYPPLYREPDTDYICFTEDTGVTSSVWKIQVVEDLMKADLEPYLEQYVLRWELQPEQIQVGSLAEDYGGASVITVPRLEELPLVKFDSQKMFPTADAEGNYIYRKNPVYSDGKYNGRPFLVTIGVPVSNQIDTIERCLFHIKPLLDQLDAELLVIDTGSTDGTVEVCKKYGARVIVHPWCDNMSAVRNEGIYNARGEWYLSIDDDEWFEDVEEILRFFREGFYRSYDQASYIQRNYMDSAGNVYEDNHTLRMARITPNLHFEGRIHDALLTESGSDTVFVLHSYAHHYGFVSDDPEKVRKKVMRNVPILLQDVYEYPENLRYLFQLANEYRNLHCTETAVGLFAQTMALAKEADDNYRGKNSMVMLCACMLDASDQRLFQWVENMEQEFHLTVPEQAFIAWSREMLAFRTGRVPKQILRYYCLYEERLQQHQKNLTTGQYQTYYGLSAVEHERYIMDAKGAAFCAYLAEKEEAKAMEILNCLSLEQLANGQIHAAVLEEGLAAENSVYEAVCRKVTVMQWEEWSWEILDAFARGYMRKPVHGRQLERLSGLLGRMSVSAVIFWFGRSEERRGEKASQLFFAYAMECEAESSPVQVLCLCAWVLKEEYVRNREAQEGRKIFYHYLYILAAFAERYYNQELLMDAQCRAIPPDIRAAYRMAVALADGKASHENVELLKQALAIFPAFHKEIRDILTELSADRA